MDNITIILLSITVFSSLMNNVLTIGLTCIKGLKRSKCCGSSEIEMSPNAIKTIQLDKI